VSGRRTRAADPRAVLDAQRREGRERLATLLRRLPGAARAELARRPWRTLAGGLVVGAVVGRDVAAPSDGHAPSRTRRVLQSAGRLASLGRLLSGTGA